MRGIAILEWRGMPPVSGNHPRSSAHGSKLYAVTAESRRRDKGVGGVS